MVFEYVSDLHIDPGSGDSRLPASDVHHTIELVARK